MPSTLLQRRKDAKEVANSKGNSLEQNSYGWNHQSVNSFDTQTLGKKCKSIAKKIIKSVSSGGLNRDKAGNSSKSDGSCASSRSRQKYFHQYECLNFKGDKKEDKPLTFLKGEVFKEYDSWEAIRDDVDTNIRGSFDIRSKYDGARPVEVYPPKQNYYYVEGYGLVSEKFLPDFKRLESNGLLDYGKKYNLTDTRAKNRYMHRDVDSDERIKNQNIVKDYNDLKRELDDIKKRKKKDTPLPVPRTQFRSKSVTFIDRLCDKNPTVCPNCQHGYRNNDEINMYKNIDEEMKKSSDQRLGLKRSQSQNDIIKPTVLKVDEGTKKNSNFSKREILRSRSFNDNTNKIYQNQIVCRSKDHVYQNFDESQFEMRKVERGVDGDSNMIESVVYVNTLYCHPFATKNTSSKNYDIKTNESKWKMDYLLDINSGINNREVFNSSQSLRLNMDRTETLVCKNHYYG